MRRRDRSVTVRFSDAEHAALQRVREAVAAEWPAAAGRKPGNEAIFRAALHSEYERRFGGEALRKLLSADD